MTDLYVGVECGATNTRFCVCQADGEGSIRPIVVREKPCRGRFNSRDFPNLGAIISMVLSGAGVDEGQLASIGVGYAGAVDEEGRASGPKAAWGLDSPALSRQFKCPVAGMNDMSSLCLGLNFLAPSQLILLSDPSKQPNRLTKLGILAPGTGVGACPVGKKDNFFVPAGDAEFGQTRWAPRTSEDDQYLVYLRRKLEAGGRVCLEAALNLYNIYQFQRDVLRIAPELEAIRFQISAGLDPSPSIGTQALKNACRLCRSALTMYGRILGAAVSDFVLGSGSFGGCYLAGGNVPKIGVDDLRASGCMWAFVDVGHYEQRMREVPVWIVNEETGDLGAALGGYFKAKEVAP